MRGGDAWILEGYGHKGRFWCLIRNFFDHYVLIVNADILSLKEEL